MTRRIDIAGKINQGGRTQLNWNLRAELAGIRWSEMLVKSHLKKGDNKQRYCGEKALAAGMSAEGELQNEWEL